jgi:hypothetical protein
VLENLSATNVNLTPEEFEAINKVVAEHGVRGDRYFGANIPSQTWG